MLTIPIITAEDLDAAYIGNNAEIRAARRDGKHDLAKALIARNNDISRYIDDLAPEVAA